MQKILLFLYLFYFVSCKDKLLCEDITSYSSFPSKKKECFDRETSIGLPFCCFVNIKLEGLINKDINICCPGTENSKSEELLELIETKAKEIPLLKGQKISINNYDCHSSYIKVAFILLSLFLI